MLVYDILNPACTTADQMLCPNNNFYETTANELPCHEMQALVANAKFLTSPDASHAIRPHDIRLTWDRRRGHSSRGNVRVGDASSAARRGGAGSAACKRRTGDATARRYVGGEVSEHDKEEEKSAGGAEECAHVGVDTERKKRRNVCVCSYLHVRMVRCLHHATAGVED